MGEDGDSGEAEGMEELKVERKRSTQSNEACVRASSVHPRTRGG